MNVIDSHVICKRKASGTAKASIVTRGHRDLEKKDPCGDALSLNLDCLRLMILLAVEPGWIAKKMDVKKAYLQTEEFERTIYERLTCEENYPAGPFKVLAAAYWLTESGPTVVLHLLSRAYE